MFKYGFDTIIVQEHTSFFKHHFERRLFFCNVNFQQASGTRGSLVPFLSEKEVKDEILLSNKLFDEIRWLPDMPHLLIDFARNDEGCFLSEIEPCGDIFFTQNDHLLALAQSFLKLANRTIQNVGS